uniref:Inhibitor_I29 domain-containing protein n=1 Tax=Loa loa TaxID=7209 RepID=A0A1I7VHQ0_LOALO
MGNYRQMTLLLKALLPLLVTQNFILNCNSLLHQQFKTLSHSKLRELYSKHYDSYVKFATEYKKGVKDDRPEPHRLLAFAKNMEEIKRHNELYKQGKSSFMLGLTIMSDMTPEDLIDEFPAIKFNGTGDPVPENLTAQPVKDINWVTRGFVTPVENFKDNRVCRMPATTADTVSDVMAALSKLQTKKLRKLSAQELIDCSGSGCGTVGDFEKVMLLLNTYT